MSEDTIIRYMCTDSWDRLAVVEEDLDPDAKKPFILTLYDEGAMLLDAAFNNYFTRKARVTLPQKDNVFNRLTKYARVISFRAKSGKDVVEFTDRFVDDFYLRANLPLSFLPYLRVHKDQEEQPETLTRRVIDYLADQGLIPAGAQQFEEVGLFNRMHRFSLSKLEQYIMTGEIPDTTEPHKVTQVDVVAYVPGDSRLFEIKITSSHKRKLSDSRELTKYKKQKSSAEWQLIRAGCFIRKNFDEPVSLYRVCGIHLPNGDFHVKHWKFNLQKEVPALKLAERSDYALIQY